MKWLDTQYWTDHRDDGKDSINQLIDHFRDPLCAAGLDEAKVFQEWKALRSTVNNFYKNVEASKVWEKMLVYKKKEFPNILLVVELVLCLSSSNSSVERVFSILTVLLSDRRLRMKHDTMEESLLISGNNSLWTDKERDDILNSAVDSYMQKRRFVRMETTVPVQGVDQNQDTPDNSVSDTDSDSDDSSFVHETDSDV